MKSFYKLINKLILINIIIFVLLILFFSYLFLTQGFNQIKADFIQKAETLLNKKITIKKIYPIFFNGIEINDFEMKNNNKNSLLYVKKIKIYLKLQDILLRRVTLNNSIQRITFDEYKANINLDTIKHEFNLSKNTNTHITSKFKLIFNQGNIKLYNQNRNIVVNLNNKYSTFNLENNTLKIDAIINPETIIFLDNKQIGFELQADGKITKDEKFSILGWLSDFKSASQKSSKRLKFTFNANQDLQTFNLVMRDQNNNFTNNIQKENQNLQISSAFNKFIFFNNHINGNIFYIQKNNFISYAVNIKLIMNQHNYVINFKGDQNQILISEINFKINKNQYLICKGNYSFYNNYLLNFDLNNFYFRNYLLNGNISLYKNKDKQNIIRLSDFKINEFKIKNLSANYNITNQSINLKTLYSSEKFYPNLIYNLAKKQTTFDLNLVDFQTLNLYKLLNINYDEKGSISGSSRVILGRNAHNLYENNFVISLNNNEFIKQIEFKSTFQKKLFILNNKILLKNNKDILLRAESTDLSHIIGNIDYNKINKKFTININNNNDMSYLINFNLEKLLNVKLKYYCLDQFYTTVNYNKLHTNKDEADVFIQTFINKEKNQIVNVDGNCLINNFLNNSYLQFNFKQNNEKINIHNLVLKIHNHQYNGNGFVDINKKNVDIRLSKIYIKGKVENNVLNLYAFINKFQNIDIFDNAIFNANGFINIKVSPQFLRVYSDLNLYNVKINDLFIPNIYSTLIYQNNNIEFKKLKIDYGQGKIDCNVESFYRKNKEIICDGVVNFKNVNYHNNLINGRLYAKCEMDDSINLKIKFLSLKLNNLDIENITEIINFNKNKITFNKLNNNGLVGEFSQNKNDNHYNFELAYLNNIINFQGDNYKNKINYNIDIKKIDLNTVKDLTTGINNANGILSGKININSQGASTNISGTLIGSQLSLRLDNIFRKFDNLNINLNIKNNVLQIKEIQGSIGEGKFRLLGEILLKNLRLDTYNLYFKTLDEKGIAFEKKEDNVLGNIVADLNIKGDMSLVNIDGYLKLNNFDFTWPLNTSSSAKTTQKSVFNKMKLNLNLNIIAGKKVRFYQDQNGIDIIVKEGGQFNIKGDVRNTHKVVGIMEGEKGTMEYFGTTFDVIYARVAFNKNHFENTPWISAKAEANTTGIYNEPVLVTMAVEGYADNNLTPKLSSAPALSEKEIFLLLNDSVSYISGSIKSYEDEQKEIDNLIKYGFVQFFDTSYHTRLITPIERKAKRFLGLDLIKIKTSILQNMLQPKIYNLEEPNTKVNNPLANSQFTVGKYLTDALLLKYSVLLVQDYQFDKLDYENQFGLEWRIFYSLNFNYMYIPADYEEGNNTPNNKFKLEWKKRFGL